MSLIDISNLAITEVCTCYFSTFFPEYFESGYDPSVDYTLRICNATGSKILLLPQDPYFNDLNPINGYPRLPIEMRYGGFYIFDRDGDSELLRDARQFLYTGLDITQGINILDYRYRIDYTNYNGPQVFFLDDQDQNNQYYFANQYIYTGYSFEEQFNLALSYLDTGTNKGFIPIYHEDDTISNVQIETSFSYNVLQAFNWGAITNNFTLDNISAGFVYQYSTSQYPPLISYIPKQYYPDRGPDTYDPLESFKNEGFYERKYIGPEPKPKNYLSFYVLVPISLSRGPKGNIGLPINNYENKDLRIVQKCSSILNWKHLIFTDSYEIQNPNFPNGIACTGDLSFYLETKYLIEHCLYYEPVYGENFFSYTDLQLSSWIPHIYSTAYPLIPSGTGYITGVFDIYTEISGVSGVSGVNVERLPQYTKPVSLFKSNSTLIAFDNSKSSSTEEFSFLNFIQSFCISNETNRLNEKYISSSTLNKSQFVEPEINLNITYLQKNDFYNEKLFGFNINPDTETNESTAKNLIKNNFFNKNAFILLSNDFYRDIACDIFNEGFNCNMTAISIGNLFLNSYSFSYSIGNLACANVNFSSSASKIDKLFATCGLQTNPAIGYKIKNWDETLIPLNKSISVPFLEKTKNNVNKNIVYYMDNFSFQNDFESTTAMGPTINTFLNGLIQSLDFSIDFSRRKLYFFNNTNVPADRKIILPIKATFNINGISTDFKNGNLKNLFSSDKKFLCLISMGDPINIDFDYYQILFENITVESFDYSLSLDGFLTYSIKCSIDIDSEKGFKIIEKNSKQITIIKAADELQIISKQNIDLGV